MDKKSVLSYVYLRGKALEWDRGSVTSSEQGGNTPAIQAPPARKGLRHGPVDGLGV